MKLFGYGGKAELGVSREFLTTSYTDLGLNRSLLGDFKANASLGFGAGSFGSGYSSSGLWGINGNLGPVSTSRDMNTNSNTIQVFDLGLTFLIGGRFTLNIDQSLFSSPSSEQRIDYPVDLRDNTSVRPVHISPIVISE